MRKFLPLFGLFCLFIAAACTDDDDRLAPDNVELNVDFKALFNGDDLAIQSATYDYPTGATLKMGLFQYYVSDLELVDTDNNAVRLSDIELIRYANATDDATDRRTFTVPEGNYVSLRFGLGVKPDLNAQDPNNFSAADPLNENEFWNPGARYVFAKIEANANLENDDLFDTGLSYHMGSDALYTTVTFTVAGGFTLDGSANDPTLVVIADVLQALSGNGETFDIADPAKQRVHGGNQAIAQDIWDRLAGQFQLQLR